MDSFDAEIARSLDAGLRSAVLGVSFCEAHKKFMEKGVDYAKGVLGEYSLHERVKMTFSREASGWDSESRSFAFVNERKIRYRVAKLRTRG